jgi:predicted nucleotidyltransferase component of viral defense system
MPFADLYRRQVALLVRVIPLVAKEKCFALKGGTAINLFVRNMPRLSIDIDLTYVPVMPRTDSLAEIDAAMKRIAERIRTTIGGARMDQRQHDGAVTSMLARADGVQTKIEVTPVLRGCVFEPELRTVSEEVEDEFGFAEIQVVSWGDLYAGKIVAALDRQHPRDLFDVGDLMANEGIDDNLRTAFIVYMLSHHRPMAEVLGSPHKDIGQEYARGFEGMTDKPVSRDDLVKTRENLVVEIVGNMPDNHRKFLMSFERGKPEWDLLGVKGASDLPAVKWRMQNLDGLPTEKRAALVEHLEKVLKKGWP